MDYVIFFAGVLTTLTLIAIISVSLHSKRSKNTASNSTRMTQSSMFLIVRNFLPNDFTKMFETETQAMYFESTKMLNYIEMPDKKVYWIDRNIIYYADSEGGKFNPKKGKALKIKDLPEKEINKVLYIMNSLKDG